MALFLTLSEGARADRSRPILALSDQRIIACVLSEISRLGDLHPPTQSDAMREPLMLARRDPAPSEVRP